MPAQGDQRYGSVGAHARGAEVRVVVKPQTH